MPWDQIIIILQKAYNIFIKDGFFAALFCDGLIMYLAVWLIIAGPFSIVYTFLLLRRSKRRLGLKYDLEKKKEFYFEVIMPVNCWCLFTNLFMIYIFPKIIGIL